MRGLSQSTTQTGSVEGVERTVRQAPLDMFSIDPGISLPGGSPLLQFLKERPYACVTEDAGSETVLVVKIPGTRIRSLDSESSIYISHEVFEHEAGPVIRIVTNFRAVDAPFSMETFVDIADPQQRREYQQLAKQDVLHLLFFDESLQHRATRAISGTGCQNVQQVLRSAEGMLGRVPLAKRDFVRAKSEVQGRTTLRSGAC